MWNSLAGKSVVFTIVGELIASSSALKLCTSFKNNYEVFIFHAFVI